MSDDRFSWLGKTLQSRFTTPEMMKEGDIAMKMPDGRFFLVGYGGRLRRPSPWDRFLSWIGR